MSTNSLRLTWAPSTGSAPIVYQPMYRVTGSTAWIPFGQPISGTSIVITGLTASTSYDFDVVASNPYGSATSPIATDATNSGNAFPAPNAVAGSQNSGSAAPILVGPQNGSAFTGAGLNITGVTITDPGAVGATSVSLLVTCSSGTLGMTIASIPVLGSGTANISLAGSFTNCQSALSTLVYTAPATPTVDTISVTFTDQNANANTLLIQIQVTTPAGVTAPNAPANLTAGAVTNTSIQLNWAASTIGTTPVYQPMFKLSTDPTYAPFGSPVSGLTAIITGLTAGAAYNLEVVASNSAGSATSAPITASTTTSLTAPNAPTNLTTFITSSSFLLSWLPSSVGSPTIFYQPMIRPTGNGPFFQFGIDPWSAPFSSAFGPQAVAPITGTSIVVTGLLPLTSYDLRVIASNTAGSATSGIITSVTNAPGGVPTDATGTQAKPAQDMLNRFGVNTHFGNGNYAAYSTGQAIAALRLIGCTLIRDSDNG